MTCQDTDRLLELRAAELASDEELAVLAQHLAGCAVCEAKSSSLEALLGAARLPPLSEHEERRVEELSRTLPPPKRAPATLRWVGMAAAVAASALLGVHFGGIKAPRRAVPTAALRASAPKVQTVQANSVDAFDDQDSETSSDADGDSVLYDAVVFQGGTMPFDLDNG